MYEEQRIEDQTKIIYWHNYYLSNHGNIKMLLKYRLKSFLIKSRQHQKIDIETKTVLYFDE